MTVQRRLTVSVGGLALLAGGCIPAAGGGDRAMADRTRPVPLPVPAAAPAAPAPADFAVSGEPTQGGWLRGIVPAGTLGMTLDGDPVSFAPDGEFFVAFDRDAGAASSLVAVLAGGKRVTRVIAVAPRSWQIEHVNVARSSGGPSEAFMRIRRPELARIAEARARNTGAAGWRQTFIWPVRGRISGRFGSQRIYRGEPGSYHSGIDVTTGSSGSVFVAPADGVVTLAAASAFSLEGNLLMLDHGNGLNSAFLHCSEILVSEGETVSQGQPIGRIGATGRATGPHLHWSVKWKDARLDPILLTGPMAGLR